MEHPGGTPGRCAVSTRRPEATTHSLRNHASPAATSVGRRLNLRKNSAKIANSQTFQPNSRVAVCRVCAGQPDREAMVLTKVVKVLKLLPCWQQATWQTSGDAQREQHVRRDNCTQRTWNSVGLKRRYVNSLMRYPSAVLWYSIC